MEKKQFARRMSQLRQAKGVSLFLGVTKVMELI